MDPKQPHVMFIPFQAQSHIKCMLKLARLLHRKGIHITFVISESNHKLLAKSGGTHWLDQNDPGFQFKTFPDGSEKQTQNIAQVWSYLGVYFLDTLLDLVARLETPLTCIICDAFMTHAKTISVTEKFKVPVILFWTMAACGFMGYYLAKALKEKGILPLKDESYLTNGYLEMEIDWIPGMEGIPLKELPEFARTTKQNDPWFLDLLEIVKSADSVSHMIIHTFEELEANLVKEIKSIFPNVYTIGPLELLLNKMTENETKRLNYSLWEEEPECVQWLQSKKPNSVLYVNFGSIVVMSSQDLVEFGWGLVNSNHEFLWIIRNDLVDGKHVVLPQELKDAMNQKGFLANWCSQEEVLNHPSVGGFLTHCGWGSIIESLSAGVPMICWPVLGDQHTNCRQMCKEWEVGMKMGKNVKREEVEKLVKVLMEGEEGKRMKKKALEWKKMAEIATGSNGSSFVDVEDLTNEITRFLRN